MDWHNSTNLEKGDVFSYLVCINCVLSNKKYTTLGRWGRSSKSNINQAKQRPGSIIDHASTPWPNINILIALVQWRRSHTVTFLVPWTGIVWPLIYGGDTQMASYHAHNRRLFLRWITVWVSWIHRVVPPPAVLLLYGMAHMMSWSFTQPWQSHMGANLCMFW